jgi:hypothetical protein
LVLVLAFASVFASYGHAACPHTTSSTQASAASVSGTPAAAEHGDGAGHQHDQNDFGNAHASCTDTLCHGGYAVLTKTASLPVRAGAVVETPIAALRIELRTSFLERPPRTSHLA